MSKRNKMTAKQKERLEKKLRKSLDNLLAVIWARTADVSLQEMAELTGLSVQTVTRLYYGAWQYPQARTIQKLGYAVGYDVAFTEDGVKVTTNENFKSWRAKLVA